jgi:hypothetical protein
MQPLAEQVASFIGRVLGLNCVIGPVARALNEIMTVWFEAEPYLLPNPKHSFVARQASAVVKFVFGTEIVGRGMPFEIAFTKPPNWIPC